MADNISNIVDPSAFSQLQQLIDLLVKTEAAISSAAEEAKNIKINIQGADNLAAISAQIDKMAAAIDNLTEIQNQNRSVSAGMIDTNLKFGQSTGTMVEQMAKFQTEIKSNNANINQLNKSIIALENDIKFFSETTGKSAAFIENSKNTVVRLTESINENKKQLEVLIPRTVELETIYKSMTTNIKLQVQAQNEELEATNAIIAAKNKESLAIATGVTARKEAIKTAKEESEARGREQKDIDAEIAALLKLNATRVSELDGIEKISLLEQAANDKVAKNVIDNEVKKRDAQQKSIDQATILEQKQVADAVLAAQKANVQIGRVGQLRIALQGLIQEYDMLLLTEQKDSTALKEKANQIRLVKEEMTLLGREIQDTTNKLSISDRISQQFGRTMIRTLAMVPELLAMAALFEGINLATEYFTKLSDAEELAKDRLDAFIDATKELKQLEAEMPTNIWSKEMQNTTDFIPLIKYYNDTNVALEKRVAVYQKIQALYPGFLLNLQKEQESGKSPLPTIDINKAEQFNKVKTEAEEAQKDKDQSLKNEADGYQVLLDLQKKRNDLFAEGLLIPGSIGSKAILGYQLYSVDNEIERQEAEYDRLQKTREAKLNDYNAKQKALLDAQVFEKGSEKESKKESKTIGLTPLSKNDTGAKKEIDALHKLIKDQLEIERDANKAIVNDTNKSLQERLNANIAYFNALNKLVQNETEKQIEDQATVIKNAQAREASLQGQLSGLEAGYGGKTKQFYKDANVQNLVKGIDTQKDIIKSAEIAMIDAQSQASVKMQKNETETQKNIFDIFDSNGKNILENQDKVDTQRQSRDALSAAMEIKTLNDKLQAKEISQQEYHERAEKINQDFRKKQLEDEVKQYQELLDATGDKRLVGDNRTKLIGKQGAAQSELNDINAGKGGKGSNSDMSPLGKLFMGAFGDSSSTGDDLKKQQQAAEQAAAVTIGLAQKTADAVKTIKDNEFAHEQDLLTKQAQQVQFEAEQRINAINASVGYNISKQNQLAIVNAQTAAQENMLKQKQQDLDIKKARFDRSAAEANVIMSTAQAEASALTLLGNPLLAPFYPAIAALIAVTGAAEFAAASSAPIPTYRFGTTATHTHTFIAGEAAENELIAPPNKPAYWSGTSAKLFHEPLGTSVTPISKLRKFAEDNLTNSIGIENDKITYILNEKPNDDSYSILADVFNDKIDTLVTAIERNRPLPLPDLNDAIRMTIKQEQLRGRN